LSDNPWPAGSPRANLRLTMSPVAVTPALPEGVASALARELASGPLRPGDRMPTEQMLVARFGVSRAVVREAISRLKSDGLVVSRRGSGLYVAPPARGRSFRLDTSALAADLAEVGAVLELREAVEVAAAGLAARRRTPAQLAAIGRAHEAMASTGDWDGEGVAADIGFHRAVAEATGNARFAGFITFLGDSLAEVIRASRAAAGEPDGARRVTVEEHARILAAVEAADAAGARRAARAHLRGARRRLGL
jgi:GntR family transcriptional repressor for pyruvate dehydrogenase complex